MIQEIHGYKTEDIGITGIGDTCKGCAFIKRQDCTNIDAACTPDERDDGRDVIFIYIPIEGEDKIKKDERK